MNKVTLTEESVEITIEGLDKLWSFKGKVTIPRDHIAKVHLRPEGMHPPWLRAPGTYVPQTIAAGTYHGAEGKEFWNTRFRDDCVAFELKNFEYTRVVIDVPNAQELISALS